ncbi:MAG: hypothetical protein HYV45_01355 [Candidatus Moranbacteria bacterium]|nr:hypothetical protein [Candidatus Moranbacteria bacterium]
MTGKMIAFYGINGIGKTTQTELLVEYLRSRGISASRLKYPVYDLEPEGPFIYKYLRDAEFRLKNELSTEDLQKKYADNRKRYEPELLKRLETGEWIVAEDYTGTGIAWGLSWGADLSYLEDINKNLHRPDLDILMDGERFDTAIEVGHRNETNDERIRICRNFHLLLGARYGWKRADANQSIEQVKEDILILIKEVL